MSDTYTVEERYANAVEAHNLLMRAERTGAADVLTAAGMDGVKHGLSLAVWRWLYGGDQNELHSIRADLVKWIIKRQPMANRNRGEIAGLVILVTDWYQYKACKACKGTRYKVIQNTGRLSNKPCPACNGSGERDFGKLIAQHGGQWSRPGQDLRQYLDHLCQDAAGAMLKKLKRDMDSL